MPSPKRKPVALKIVEGRSPGRDSGGRPIVEGPAFARAEPHPPVWLEGEALAEWHRVVPELVRLEVLRSVDTASLTAYCQAWARFVDAEADVRRMGRLLPGKVVSVTEDGERIVEVKRNPALVTLENASKELRAWAGEFGLTPSAEARLVGKGADGGDDPSPFA